MELKEGLTPDQTLALVEANPFNGIESPGCDLVEVVHAPANPFNGIESLHGIG